MSGIERCTKRDFDAIITDHARFWDTDLTLRLHHPIFLHEFGDTALVIRRSGQVVAYLFGFFSQTGPVAYVHMVAVRQGHRGQGLARRLYGHFVAQARARDCERLKATASPANASSIQFHHSIGMRSTGVPNDEGVLVEKDYLKPGSDRVVFVMALDGPEADALLSSSDR